MHRENDDQSTNLMSVKLQLLALSDSYAQLNAALVNTQHYVIMQIFDRLLSQHTVVWRILS